LIHQIFRGGVADALGIVKTKLQQAAGNDQLFEAVFGEKANTVEFQSIRGQWEIGDFSQLPTITVLDPSDMRGNFGAYASNGIYLSSILFQSNAAPTSSVFGASGVLVEEIGHFLDAQVGVDTRGDEGEYFRNSVFGVTPDAVEQARINAEDDLGIIVLNGQSLAVEKNDTLGTADNLGVLNSVCMAKSGWVGTYYNKWVPNDYYRFQLTNSATIDLKLLNLENDVDLYLLNSNGIIIQSSTNPQRSQETISRQLGVGIYYIQVKQYTQNSGNSRYDLGINSVLDSAGNNRDLALYIGFLGTNNVTYFDAVGDVDKNDFYKFDISGTRDLRLSLTGLSADADLEVLDSSGTRIDFSNLSGSRSESVSINNLGAGTYYARVSQYTGDTSYNLSLRAENRFDQYMATVRQLYLDVLNREPDAGGQQGWANAMLSGSTYAQVRSGIANSQESKNNVNAAYQNVLLRNAEAGGLQGYVNALANGSTLRQVYENIANSNEARSNFWTAQYYNNTDRNGSVVFAQSFGRTNTGFDRNWGYGSPSGWVSSDNFSARIFGQVSFAAGLQEIRVGADDGVRVRVNGQTVIDRLVDQAFTTNTAVFNAGNGGKFNVEIEYYERGGAAALNFSTKSLSEIPTGQWQGQYFNNRSLSGNPAIVRNESKIDNNWDDGSPDGRIGNDNFSVRWTGNFDFGNGSSYQFRTLSDDGIRLYVDNNLVIDQWNDHQATEYVASLYLRGQHKITVEYYENGGKSIAKAWWIPTTIHGDFNSESYKSLYTSTMTREVLTLTTSPLAASTTWGYGGLNPSDQEGAKKMLNKYKDFLVNAAKYYGIDGRAIAGAIRWEYENNWISRINDSISYSEVQRTGNLGGFFHGCGWGKMHFNDPSTAVDVLKEEGKNYDARQIAMLLALAPSAIDMIAKYMRQAVKAYYEIAGVDIHDKPEILATLYNTGNFEKKARELLEKRKSSPNANPEVGPNAMGQWVQNNLRELDLYKTT
jgi:hypothetical protein